MARAVAWVAPGNLHLTLKFLGSVEEERIDAIVAALRGAVSDAAAFEAVVNGLGAFPTPTRPRVVWAGMREGAQAMITLAGRVDAALATLGFPREARPFSPHVTLGRVRVPRRDLRLAEALAKDAAREFGRLRVERLALMQSRLSPTGSQYTELESVGIPGH